jgi:hypothetical protein
MIVMVAVLGGATYFVRRAADPLPADWSLDELDSTVKRAVGLDQGGNLDIRLLAWKTVETRSDP